MPFRPTRRLYHCENLCFSDFANSVSRNILASILGVLVAFPMKRRFINDEQQPFPEGRAAAVVLDSLYPHAPRGGTLHMKDNMPQEHAPVETEGGVDMGLFKAKALAWAAGIGATLQLLVAGGYMAMLQIRSPSVTE